MLASGSRVRVRDAWPERAGPVHVRTPHYLRGREGVVVAWLGDFANPEELAFGRPAQPCPLFHILFDAATVFPCARAGDDLLVEIFGHWLEPA